MWDMSTEKPKGKGGRLPGGLVSRATKGWKLARLARFKKMKRDGPPSTALKAGVDS